MTNDKLKGRDLDRAVAQTIMGWKVEVRSRKAVSNGETILHWQIESPKGFWWDLEQSEREAAKASASWWCDQVNLPRYSSNYDDAKEVLARLGEMGWKESAQAGSDWHALDLSDGKRTLHFDIGGKRELSTVICLAGLAAVDLIKTK